MYNNQHEKKIAESMGYAEGGKPWVSFFDHAIPDPQAPDSGRPRFKEAVYIQKIPSAPDLVKRDVFTRKATEEDKHEFPEAWKRYLQRKAQLDPTDAPIVGIPGMTVAAKAELEALDIRTCKQFVAHEPLEGLEELREMAKRIIEVANDDHQAKRETVRVAEDRQVHDSPRRDYGGDEWNVTFQL